MCKWKFDAFQPHFTVIEAGPWWNGGPITHFGSVNQAFCKWRQTIARYSACFPDGKQTSYNSGVHRTLGRP